MSLCGRYTTTLFVCGVHVIQVAEQKDEFTNDNTYRKVSSTPCKSKWGKHISHSSWLVITHKIGLP